MWLDKKLDDDKLLWVSLLSFLNLIREEEKLRILQRNSLFLREEACKGSK